VRFFKFIVLILAMVIPEGYACDVSSLTTEDLTPPESRCGYVREEDKPEKMPTFMKTLPRLLDCGDDVALKRIYWHHNDETKESLQTLVYYRPVGLGEEICSVSEPMGFSPYKVISQRNKTRGSLINLSLLEPQQFKSYRECRYERPDTTMITMEFDAQKTTLEFKPGNITVRYKFIRADGSIEHYLGTELTEIICSYREDIIFETQEKTVFALYPADALFHVKDIGRATLLSYFTNWTTHMVLGDESLFNQGRVMLLEQKSLFNLSLFV
jgi:hypothetical protein